MKKIIIAFFLIIAFNISNAQKIKGDWVLDEMTIIGGEYKNIDKMLLGDGLILHLGNNSHLSITVLHNGNQKVKHKDTWFDGESFILLNDKLWGNAHYNILKVNKNQLTLERFVEKGVEIILTFNKLTRKNHLHNFEIINRNPLKNKL